MRTIPFAAFMVLACNTPQPTQSADPPVSVGSAAEELRGLGQRDRDDVEQCRAFAARCFADVDSGSSRRCARIEQRCDALEEQLRRGSVPRSSSVWRRPRSANRTPATPRSARMHAERVLPPIASSGRAATERGSARAAPSSASTLTTASTAGGSETPACRHVIPTRSTSSAAVEANTAPTPATRAPRSAAHLAMVSDPVATWIGSATTIRTLALPHRDGASHLGHPTRCSPRTAAPSPKEEPARAPARPAAALAALGSREV